jgi:hypothetical protein
MSDHDYLESLGSVNMEPLQLGGSDAMGGGRRRGRALAALLFGATTVVGPTEELPVVAPAPVRTTTHATGSAPIVPAHFRPASDRCQTVGRVLANAQMRVETNALPAQAVATLALEIERLQRDLAMRAPDGMEEWIGQEYASLEAIRRAVADAVVDGEDLAVVAVALDRASQLLSAAA